MDLGELEGECFMVHKVLWAPQQLGMLKAVYFGFVLLSTCGKLDYEVA